MTQAGLGLYTLTDAARLIHTDRRAVKRWLCGYSYSVRRAEGVERRQAPPLWPTQYAAEALGEEVIGFHDLLELRIVREFVGHGVPLQVVRHCLNLARDLFGADHPLSRRRFVTDGETIYADSVEAAKDNGELEPGLLDLRSRQFAFKTIVKGSLYAGIEYHQGVATRWYPQPRSKAVVIDPQHQFGQPMLEDSGVPTATLYAAYLAEGQRSSTVSRLFDVPVRQVDAAVRFETQLRQPA